ncbi:hypothetical protein C8F04DRAFT_396784 [Mycena alexandri]|uniref:Uncharacterized protein n=1 Tax=Mycena alexandri TaxID=1745969 RepID=A0AAD6T4S4_9AGAR|nr:hypothetical protein C8F04DRAFT_396784 [Mycena alexandri]
MVSEDLIVLAMFVPTFLVLLASAVSADFHFLSCASTGPFANAIPTNPTIAVPTSDLANCAGILGPSMVVLQNLTQPISQTGKFSIDNFCKAPRLDVYLESSDALQMYYSGGDGTLIGACTSSVLAGDGVPARFSCSSETLSLNCTDRFALECTPECRLTVQPPSYFCFSGICETPRAGSTTVALTPPASRSASGVPSASISVPPIQSNSTDPALKDENGRASQKTSIIVGAVLGPISFCLALAIGLLIWRHRQRGDETRAADEQVQQPYLEVRPRSETIRPFVATQSLQTSMSESPKTRAGPVSAVTSPTVREEVREAVFEAVREAIPQRNRTDNDVQSWMQTFPPSYSHRGDLAG